jgi:hypothetical protein
VVQAKSRLRTRAKRPTVGGPKPIVPTSEAAVELALALVARVNVVVAAEAPRVTLAGENEAEHLLGRPEQVKAIGASNEPYCGFTWIVYVAVWPAVTDLLDGFAAVVKLATWSARAPVNPPTGAGLKTVTWTSPPAARSEAGMAACSSAELTYVVVLSLPFKRTTELGTKFEPRAVSVKAAPPPATFVVESEDSVGTGLSTANARALEIPPPGFRTVTWTVFPVARSETSIAPSTSEALTKVVGRSLPSHLTTAPSTKPEPTTVRRKAGSPA